MNELAPWLPHLHIKHNFVSQPFASGFIIVHRLMDFWSIIAGKKDNLKSKLLILEKKTEYFLNVPGEEQSFSFIK